MYRGVDPVLKVGGTNLYTHICIYIRHIIYIIIIKYYVIYIYILYI